MTNGNAEALAPQEIHMRADAPGRGSRMAAALAVLRRVGWARWLLALVATGLLVLLMDLFDTNPVYHTSIAPSAADGEVIVVFWGTRYDDYQKQGHLEVPATGWEVKRAADHVRLRPERGAAPLQLGTKDVPVYVSFVRHAGGGGIRLDSGAGFRTQLPLRARTESLRNLVVGGPSSDLPPAGGIPKIPRRVAAAVIGLTFLLLAIATIVDAARTSAPVVARQAWADLCRGLAIFGVVVIHACGPSFYDYGKIPQDTWLSAAFIDSVVRCAVPLFVMLSGALLLKPGGEVHGPRELAGRVSRVLLPLLAWNVVYLLYIARLSGQPVDWFSMLAQPPMYHLWFAYMIIGVYLVLPVLQPVYAAIVGRRDLQVYLLALWLAVTSLPLYIDVPLLALLQQPSLLGYGGYFIIGALVAAHAGVGRTWMWAAIFAACVLLTFALTWGLTRAAGAAVETAYVYFSVNVLLASVAAFMLLARSRPPARYSAALLWISDRSFLVFFMHPLVLERIKKHFDVLQLPSVVELLLVSLATFVLCLGLASVLRLIPKSRELIG